MEFGEELLGEMIVVEWEELGSDNSLGRKGMEGKGSDGGASGINGSKGRAGRDGREEGRGFFLVVTV